MLQETIFSEGEGDAWFNRNPEPYEPEVDPVLRCLESHSIQPGNILEIGARRGDRLAELHKRYDAKVTGVDPSTAALDHGRAKFPGVRFIAATARALPLIDESFDLVIATFVFHWIDRKSLLTSAAEVDRVLKPAGYLIIGDFAPFAPKKVRYHHRVDVAVYTYKQDYPALFLATAGYVTVAQQLLDHQTLKPDPDVSEHERFSLTLLKKMAEGIYST
jgi:ubiquinone/menaquinone biosynthesis C-methylase UbiE